MSTYAIQAVLTAAAENDDMKARLQDESTFEEAVDEILTLSEAEKEELLNTMLNPDTTAPVMEEEETRANPSPGIPGGGKFL